MDFVERKRLEIVQSRENPVFVFEVEFQLVPQDIGMEKILDPNSATAEFIDVCGADAAPGRPDLFPFAPKRFLRLVDNLVIGHHNVSGPADNESRPIHALRLKILDLGEKLFGVDDDAVSYDAQLSGIQHSRGQEVKHIFLSVDDHGVSRIAAALIPREYIHTGAKAVDDPSFSLIAPLGSDNDFYPSLHGASLLIGSFPL